MKSKDIMIIVGVAIVAAIFSYVLAGYIFGGEDSEKLTAPIVQPISAEFPQTLDDRFYNPESLNLTQVIIIGEGAKDKPF